MSNAIWLENARKRRKAESEQKRTPSTSTDTGTGTGWLERARQRKYNEDVQNVDSSYINLFVDTANDFFSSAEEDYNNVGWWNAYKAYQNRENSKNDLEYRSNVIRDWLKNNQGRLDANTLQALTNSLDYFSTNAQSVVDSFSGARDFYSQFETEDAYNEYAARKEEYDALLNFDLEAGAREIEELERRKEELESSGRQQPGSTYLTGDPATTTSSYAAAHQDVDIDRALAELNALISEKTAYLNNARRAQDGAALAGAAQNADFDQFSGYAGDGTAPVMPSYNDIIYGWVNGKHHDLDLGVSTQSGSISYSDAHRLAATDYMTPDEVAIYNYHYNKDGLEAAERYLDSILEELNRRSGEKTYESELKDRTAVEMLYGAIAGFDQFASGLDSAWQAFLGDGGYIPVSATQYASGMAREDLADVGFKLPDWLGGGTVGQATYDAITTTSNMLPSILASIAIGTVSKTAGAAVGSALMGASAGGGAYQEKLNEGYSQEQARAYGITVGVSEVVLEKLLGGISRLGGGMLPDSVLKNLAKADNVLARFAKTVGGQMLMSAGSEALEEGLQTVIEPYLWQIISGQEATVDWQEVFYSALLGAVTGGLFEGGEIAMNTAASNAQANQIYGTDASALVAEALELNPDNAFAKQMQTRLDKGKELTGGQLNRLVQQNERVIAKQEQDIKTAESAEKQIDAQEYGRMVAAAEATQESTEIKVGQDTTPQQNVAQGPEAEPVGAVDNKTEPATEESSADQENGVARQKSTGKTVTPQQITSIKDGKVMIRTDAGPVSADDIEFGDATTDLLWSSAAQIQGITPATANGIIRAYQSGQPVTDYLNGATRQFRNGYYNMEPGGAYVNKLTPGQREIIYALGQEASGKNTAREQAKVTTAKKNAAKRQKKGGKVHFDRNGRTFDAKQETALKTMEQLSKALGVEFYVYESYVNEAGERVYIDKEGKEVEAPNGFYDPEDGSIHIDLNAGNGGKGTMLFTIAHELTHFIREWSPAKFKILANVLLKQYTGRDVSVAQLIENQKAKALKTGRTIDDDTAFEEVVADSMEAMLVSGNVTQMMADVKAQDQSLWQKIRQWFQDLAADLKAVVEAYKGYKPDSPEGRMVADMRDAIVILESFYADALLDASENYQAARAEKNTTQEGGVKYSQRYLAAETNAEILAMVTKVSNGDFTANERVYLGTVSDTIADQINELTGIRVNGFKVAIEARQIDHILKDHGVNGDADHSMADPDDIAKMEYVLGNPDDIRKAGKTQAYTYMRNGRNRTADTVLYEKKIGTKSYYVVQAVPDTKAKTLYIVTAFIGNSGYKKEAPQLINANGPDATAKTGSVNASMDNIRNDGEIVNKKFSYAGEHAENADLAALERAKEMLRAGVAEETIRQETGWFRGKDGKWRFEIDDSTAQVSDSLLNYMTLEELLPGAEIFRAYPDMKDIAVVFQNLEPGVNASYDRQFDSINVDYRLKGDPDGIRRAVLHEIQHAIQSREGFSSGATVGSWNRKIREGFDPRKASDIRDAQESERKLEQFREEDPQLYRDMMELDAMAPDLPRGKIDWDTLEQIEEDPPEWQAYDARRDALEEIYGDRMWDLMGVMHDLELIRKRPARTAEELYWDTAGEIEARSVAGRRDMTAQERKKKPPILGGEDTVFADGTGEIREQSSVSQFLSERDPELEKVNRVLEKENAELKEDVGHLKELLKLQKQVTGGTKFTKTSVEAAAGQLMKYAGSKGDKKALAALLEDVYEHIAKGEELTWDSVKEAARPAVEWLQNHNRIESQPDRYAREILREIRGAKVYLDEGQKEEAAYQYGSYEAFRRKMFGSVTITDNAGMSLDSQWHEWARIYPNIFDGSMSASDMPGALPGILDKLRSMTEMEVFSYDRDLQEQDLLRQVYDSYWNVSTLYTVADKYQKQINRLKVDHANRMADIRKRNADQIAKLKQEHKDAVEKVREREAKKVQELQDKYDRAKARTSDRRRNEMRKKIRKTIMELNRLLTKGDKKRNVKEGMQDFVAQALASAEVLFMDNYSEEDMVRYGVTADVDADENRLLDETQRLLQQRDDLFSLGAIGTEAENVIAGDVSGYEKRLKQSEKLDKQIAANMKKLQGVFQRERAKLNNATVSAVLDELAAAYRKLGASEDPYIRNVTDENVYQHLLQLSEDMQGAIVKDMTMKQLEELHKAYTMVLTTVRNANKMFAQNMKQTLQQLGNQTIEEVKRAGGEHGLWGPGADKLNAFSWNNEKPVYAFERIGSETLKQLFANTRAGEDTWAVDMNEAREYYLEKAKKHGYDNWDLKEQYEFTSASGVDFALNLEQIMSLYAYSKREQAHDHLIKGGFVFDRDTEVQVNKMGIKMTYRNKTAKAHNVSLELLGQIVETLTAEQRAFVDEMQDYLSTTMGEKGNKVAMQLYGVRLFKEKNYFPLRSAGQYMARAKEADLKKQQGQISIANSGFTKATTPKSSNPVVLSGFMDVWADHVNEMSMYHAFVLPMEDFRRVYNYASPNVEEGQSVSVNSVIQNAYGQEATDYIDQLYRDLNGGAITDPRDAFIKRLTGKFKKAAVFASLSVVVQQPSAIGRAFAIVDPKYFVGQKIDKKRHGELWAELKQHAPVAAIKEMGYFDTGMGRSARDYIKAKEYQGIKEVATGIVTDSGYRDELLGKLPALADEVTWCGIWEAVKRETKANNPGMDVKSEAFLKLAGERFTEVVTKTQVYDSVLARSANMRSKGLMTLWTPFMAEPTTTINMVEDALRKGKQGDRKYAAKTIGAVMSSVVLNSVLVSFVRAMRDDDEDETFLEKYFQAFSSAMLDGLNPLTYYPFLKDVWSILQGFDIERADMSLIDSTVEAVTKLIQLYSKGTEGMTEEQLAAHEKKLASAWWGVVDYATALAGLPVKNVRREINGAINLVKTIVADWTERDTSWGSFADKIWDEAKNTIPVIGWLPDETAADKLYKATVNGDEAYRKRLASSYGTEDQLNSAIRRGMRDNDPRIWEAAIAWNNNDLDSYMRIAREIIGEGHFTQDNVVMAIRAEAQAMLDNEANSSDPNHKSYFTAEKFAISIQQGNAAMADTIRSDIIKTAQRNGKTRDEAVRSFNSSAKSEMKALFLEGELTRTQVIRALTDYCGADANSAKADVEYWAFQQKYPNVHVDDSWFDTYYAKVADSGLRIDVYMEYRNAVADITGDSKKERRIAVIDSLPISDEQKDALYLAEGWAESTLDEAPWH